MHLGKATGFKKMCLRAGGEIASTFDHPDLLKLGECDLIEEIMIGEDKVRVQCLSGQGRCVPLV